FLRVGWWASDESLSDYEVVKSFSVRSRIECSAAASVQRQLRTVRSLQVSPGPEPLQEVPRSLNKAAPRGLWTAGSDCWTTVQHRVSGSVDFYRNWTQYQSEFGEGPDGNYWIGLNALHEITQHGSHKVRFLMKAWNGSEHWAEYSSFSVGPESDNYRLSVSGFSGSAGIGDCFSALNGQQFTTKDADHDTCSDCNCAVIFHGAWWFTACHCTHPNEYYRDASKATGDPYAQGVIWSLYFGYYYTH
uniref:Fibrinogen C-terminal domain-containing protein n=1 Tax=Macrostomum lignano TaxID=282301 RepID=A0A1I8J7V5_9PLAT